MNQVNNDNIVELMRQAHTNQRQTDLVRYARGYLFDKELITPEEYTAIACENVGAPTRLEDYDQVQATLGAENAKLKADNEKLLMRVTELSLRTLAAENQLRQKIDADTQAPVQTLQL
jgi:hypothetical protein